MLCCSAAWEYCTVLTVSEYESYFGAIHSCSCELFENRSLNELCLALVYVWAFVIESKGVTREVRSSFRSHCLNGELSRTLRRRERSTRVLTVQSGVGSAEWVATRSPNFFSRLKANISFRRRVFGCSNRIESNHTAHYWLCQCVGQPEAETRAAREDLCVHRRGANDERAELRQPSRDGRRAADPRDGAALLRRAPEATRRQRHYNRINILGDCSAWHQKSSGNIKVQ